MTDSYDDDDDESQPGPSFREKLIAAEERIFEGDSDTESTREKHRIYEANRRFSQEYSTIEKRESKVTIADIKEESGSSGTLQKDTPVNAMSGATTFIEKVHDIKTKLADIQKTSEESVMEEEELLRQIADELSKDIEDDK